MLGRITTLELLITIGLGMIIYFVVAYKMAQRAEDSVIKVTLSADDVLANDSIGASDMEIINEWIIIKNRFREKEKRIGITRAMLMIPLIAINPKVFIASMNTVLVTSRILSTLHMGNVNVGYELRTS